MARKESHSRSIMPVDYSKKLDVSIERNFYDMTSIIGMQTKKSICIGADSWNTNPRDNHFIQKLFVNKDKSVVIASAGDNSKSYDDYNIIYVKDIITELLNAYTSFDVLYNNLILKSAEFLEDMDIEDRAKFIQYYIAWIDEGKIKTMRVEIKKVKEAQLIKNENLVLNEIGTSKEYYMYIIDFTKEGNPAFNCIGTYAELFNTNKRHIKKIPKETDNIQKIVFNKIRQQIQKNDREKKNNKADKTIGNPIYEVYMDIQGNVCTYMNGVEENF